MKDKKETRAIPLDLAEFRMAQLEDGTKVLEGYAAVFDSLSEDLGGFREKIARGAFKGALKDSDARMLYNHNDDYPLARQSNGSLELKEDKKGLYVRAKMPKWADWIVESIELGNVDKMSFGFWVGEDVWEHDENIRTITRVAELVEVSPVVFPAYPATNIDVALRRRDQSLGTTTMGTVTISTQWDDSTTWVEKSTEEGEPKLLDSEEIGDAPKRFTDSEIGRRINKRLRKGGLDE